MSREQSYFFCGIGGSGMLPLAMILRARGFRVEGSDRSLDQGRTAAKFEFLRARGIALFAQDGSGVRHADQVLVTSAAVEETVPDVVAARRLGLPMMRRAELLAELFNAAPLGIAVGGTSGKSTTTGMIGFILHEAGRDPTIMNGAVMKNFISPDIPFASALAGAGDAFVSEVDESDGSIALYRPRIAVINNISLDHKSMAELRALFGEFAAKAERVVLNLDNDETARLATTLPRDRVFTFSSSGREATFRARNIAPAPASVGFLAANALTGEEASVRLAVPGVHNVQNALAALAAASAAGIALGVAAASLERFSGIKRRFEIVGTANGVTVIDDFAHNPDKIAATLATLHDFPGRLIVLFQPHGYGPLKHMGAALIEGFVQGLASDDILLMPEPVYFGGTTDRSVSSRDITKGVAAAGRRAEAFAERAAAGEAALSLARAGDRIIVMGARDDTLSEFAGNLVATLAGRASVK